MQCIQVYDKQEVRLKQTTIPLIATINTTVLPQKAQAVTSKLDMTSQKTHIEGRSVSWIVTRDTGYPLQPVVTGFITNTTSVCYMNNTQRVQKFYKGETLGFLNLRSKDLTHLQWLVPVNSNKVQYDLYGHTAFVNALAQQPLAEETIYQQNTNTLEVRKKPFKDNKKITKSNQDPYPWLDQEDPCRFYTDNELIKSKIDLSKSILTPEEKTEVVEMLKQK